MLRKVLLVWMCLGLVGCGTIKKQWTEFAPDRDAAYLKEKSTPSLAMPSGMAMNKAYLSDPYPMPKGALPKAGAKPIDIFPPTVKKVAEKDMKKETVDDDQSDAS